MLPREQRIARGAPFRTVMKHGTRVPGTLIGMQFMRVKRPERRFSVVVSTKVAKRAVVRNRLRRRVYAQLAELLPVLPKGVYGIIRLTPRAATASRAEIRAATMQLLRRAGLLPPPSHASTTPRR